MNNDNTQTSNKTTRNVFLAVLAVALLAGAAFVGGSLLREQETALEKDDFKILTAEGLPETPFEVIGGVISQEGNSLFVQARQMNESLGMVGGKGVDRKGGSVDSGPPIEVVITHDTEFFRDSTWDAYLSGEAKRGDLKGGGEVQQEIVPGSAEEVGPGSSVTVWGERNGDRVVAEFILYSLPFPEGDKKITK